MTETQQHVDEIILSLGIMEAQCMGDEETEGWATTHTHFVLKALLGLVKPLVAKLSHQGDPWEEQKTRMHTWLTAVEREKWAAVERMHEEAERTYRESIINPKEGVSSC